MTHAGDFLSGIYASEAGEMSSGRNDGKDDGLVIISAGRGVAAVLAACIPIATGRGA